MLMVASNVLSHVLYKCDKDIRCIDYSPGRSARCCYSFRQGPLGANGEPGPSGGTVGGSWSSQEGDEGISRAAKVKGFT